MTVWPALSLGAAGALLDDPEMAALFSAAADIAAMRRVEAALAAAQVRVGVIGEAAGKAIAEACASAVLDEDALVAGLRRDGVIAPELVRQLRGAIAPPHDAVFHRGVTSQDLVDTSLMLRLRQAVALMAPRLQAIIAELGALSAAHGDRMMMARTRYQDALPVAFKDRIESWRAPLRTLVAAAPTSFPLQLGGPVGVRRAAFGPEAGAIAAAMAAELQLSCPDRAWHTDRRPVAAIADWFSQGATALGKLGQDAALMAQTPVAEIALPGGGSSAMAHKKNPVGAELLVTLARYAAGHRAMLETAALHENERSGAAWTLEWLALPPLVISAGASARAAAALLAGLEMGPRAAE